MKVIKKVIMIIGFVALILISGCSSEKEYDKELLSNYLKDYELNKEINICINKSLNREYWLSYSLIDKVYEDCRYNEVISNYTIIEINYTCNKLKTFIDIDYYPEESAGCFTFCKLDRLTNITSCNENCETTIFKERFTYNNFREINDYKEHYLDNCINEYLYNNGNGIEIDFIATNNQTKKDLETLK